ncbi:MAG TPA: hypothetical protein VHE99_02835 [Gammaproteobacteria bacterium]|nr:hypothetical protein [Gammaproteobacteria bacterium]
MGNKDIFYQSISESALYQMYLEMKIRDPKTEEMSTSLYLTCITIQILEELGNKFPTQDEIDSVEAQIIRFHRRKELLKKVA